ncbi:MAG: tRNA pseudouridine(13) synthase TruD [Candidatus Andersenbacteria bacterium]|nr:tRNA pseudouridine(13) synthase TruD [Candidatus Andersenbacteria bacterium]
MDYKIKCINEDFQVTEVPLMPRLAQKRPYKYSYFWLHAITEQLMSARGILSDKDVAAFNKKHKFKNKFARIKNIVGYGNEPVKERMLHGNSFRIVVRNLKDVLAQSVLDYVLNRRHHHLINYYDNQRFGMPGGPYNTHLIGKALAENDWKQAYEHARITNNIISKKTEKPKSISGFKEFFKTTNPKKLAFFVSSYNSFLWNKEASLMVKKHSRSKLHQFPNVGDLHLPVDHIFQCPHICEAEGYEFVPEKFGVRPKINTRNMVVATTVYGNNLENDELHDKKKKLTLSFFLPTGSYATMMIKQLFLRLNNR